MTPQQVAAAWPVIRPSCIHAVAEANGVRTRHWTSNSTWGSQTFSVFHPGDVLRVARAIGDGTAGTTAEQRRDTPEGRAAQAGLGRDGTQRRDRGCLIVTVVVVAVILFLIWAALNSEGDMPSYWH